LRYDLPSCLLHVLRELRSRSRSRLQSDTDRVLFGNRVTCSAQITKRLQRTQMQAQPDDGLHDFRVNPHADGHRTEQAQRLDNGHNSLGDLTIHPCDCCWYYAFGRLGTEPPPATDNLYRHYRFLAACRRERFPRHQKALGNTTNNPILMRFSRFSPTNC